ncbi:MAG: hypothetical protein AAFO96_29760, partial [Bacteroidota bacterium]
MHSHHPSLIFDVGGSTAYTSFPTIDPAIAHKHKGQNGKIYKIAGLGDMTEAVLKVYGFGELEKPNKAQAFINGNLFLEDAHSYLDSSLGRHMRGIIKATKQHGLNLFISYHSLDEVSDAILKMGITSITFKKTMDELPLSRIPKIKKRFSSNYGDVMEAFYKALLKGYDAPRIAKFSNEAILGIARDLGREDLSTKTPKERAQLIQFLVRYGNGKLRLTAKEKEEGMFFHQTVMLR